MPRQEVLLADGILTGGTGTGGGDPVVVGSPPVWRDDSDSSYVRVVTDSSGPGQPQFFSSAAVMGADVTYTDPILPGAYCRVRVRLRGVESGLRFPLVRIVQPDGLPFGPLDAPDLAPNAPTWFALRMSFTDLPNLFANPDQYQVQVTSRDVMGAAGLYHWDIYEVRLDAFLPGSVAPPCRLFPREDGLGVGGGRRYPPPKSQQRSARRFGYY